jgi:hypothetical protein
MNQFEKYHFADFTRNHYEACIDAAKENYEFVGYDNCLDERKSVLWRHDVDFSIHIAKKLAEIEARKNVKATYFIYPHCEFYNLLEKEIFGLVKDIQNLGHDIGLHFDSHFYNISNANELDESLKKEKNLLDTFFDIDVKVFSFHNNNEFTMSCEEWKYGGMINTYAKYFKSEVGYCSDSNGIWRFSRLMDVLIKADHPKLHILTHPEWWQEEPMAPRQKIQRCIDERAAKNLKYYDDLLSEMNRPNIR